MACDGQSVLPPRAPSRAGSPGSGTPAPIAEPVTRWRSTGRAGVSRIDFLGAEFTPEAAAASGDRGVPESGSGAELESGPHAGACSTSPPPPRWATPEVYTSGPGLAARPHFFPPLHALELKTEPERASPR